MASLNPLTRELVFKLVFYGPGLGGKTTCLYHIHETTQAENRGNLVSLATPTDRTIYFDFLPLRLPRVRDLGVRLQLFTVPGQVYYTATRKLVLTGADAVVFVADSQEPRMEANVESLEDLERNLADHGHRLENFPIVFQWNKRDLPGAIAIEELERRLNPHKFPSVESTATTGAGVYEALEKATKLAVGQYLAELPATKERPQTPALSESNGMGDAIRSALEATNQAVTVPPKVPPGSGTRPAPSPPPPSTRAPRSGRPVVPVIELHESESRVSIAGAPAKGPSGGSNPAQGRESAPAAVHLAAIDAQPLVRTQTSRSDLGRTNGLNGPPSQGPRSQGSRAQESGSNYSATGIPQAGTASQASMGSQASSAPQGNSRSMTPLAVRAVSSIGFTLSDLFPSGERPLARRVEELLASGDAPGALDACDDLVHRRLAAGTAASGHSEAPRDPAIACMLLGIDGRRFLKFRALVRAVRQGGEATVSEAMEYYLFLLEVRRATDLMR